MPAAAGDVLGNRRVAAGFGSAHVRLRRRCLSAGRRALRPGPPSSGKRKTNKMASSWTSSVDTSAGERSSSSFCKHMRRSCHDNSSGEPEAGVMRFTGTSTRGRQTQIPSTRQKNTDVCHLVVFDQRSAGLVM